MDTPQIRRKTIWAALLEAALIREAESVFESREYDLIWRVLPKLAERARTSWWAARPMIEGKR